MSTVRILSFSGPSFGSGRGVAGRRGRNDGTRGGGLRRWRPTGAPKVCVGRRTGGPLKDGVNHYSGPTSSPGDNIEKEKVEVPLHSGSGQEEWGRCEGGRGSVRSGVKQTGPVGGSLEEL